MIDALKRQTRTWWLGIISCIAGAISLASFLL